MQTVCEHIAETVFLSFTAGCFTGLEGGLLTLQQTEFVTVTIKVDKKRYGPILMHVRGESGNE